MLDCPFSGADAPKLDDVDVAIVRAVNNAEFRRVGALRRQQPNLPIVVIGDRDRAAAAYMAGPVSTR